MKRSSSDDGSPNNAFALLMGSSGKKQKKRSSRFVLCPAGCGKHVADIEINTHLDSCIQRGSFDSRQEPVSNNTSDPNSAKISPVLSKPDSSSTTTDQGVACKKTISPDKDEQTHVPSKPGPSTPEPSNIFSHMMKRSMQVFSTAEARKVAQRFHLNADGSVSLICYSTNPGLSQPEDIKWSATVQVKNKACATQASADKPAAAVELIVSSAIDTATRKPRLVGRHSRLSIPVLKSILQKSIRRRKPLPSLRVAMELADKSLGDLLRRLPIIILEDSTLHPSFSLLTWLMVAHSKDFEIPPNLMVKVLCVVYEMASCPWQDHLVTPQSDSDDDSSSSGVSICAYHKPGIDNTLEAGETIIWCMLLRAEYGGMACDIRMLHEYAKAWRDRFSQGDVPELIARRLSASLSTTSKLQWVDLPALLHQSSSRQSPSRVGEICQQGIPCLTMMDITTEGVDFHCSSTLDSILSDRELVEQCYKRLEGGIVLDSCGLDPIPDGSDRRRSWLEGVLKKCMWNYSAGINRRLSLTRIDNPKRDNDELKNDFWGTLILPRTKAFAEKYIKERL